MIDRCFYVYVHKRATDGSVFYIGKGKGARDKSRSGRSKHWRNIVQKNGYSIERIFQNLTEDEAYLLEIKAISEYRGKDERICNVANGGNGGLSGTVLTDDHKEKLRNAKLGKQQMKDHAIKSAKAKIGKKQPIEAVNYVIGLKKKKVINSDGEIFESASHAARVMSESLGIYVSQGNISMCAIGKRKNAYGKTWSYEISKKPKFLETKYNCKKIKCSNGIVFESVQKAKDWVKSIRGYATHQSISLAARKNKPAYGYKWSYET